MFGLQVSLRFSPRVQRCRRQEVKEGGGAAAQAEEEPAAEAAPKEEGEGEVAAQVGLTGLGC